MFQDRLVKSCDLVHVAVQSKFRLNDARMIKYPAIVRPLVLSIFIVSMLLMQQAAFAELPIKEKSTAGNLQPSNQKIDNNPETAVATDADAPSVLPEVKVNDTRVKDERINKTQSITIISTQDMERSQPSNIFDAVRDVPGVSIDGGPRLTGMSFNIRGFSDNEDVAIRVDGVQKNFEKYRMSGTFIEPELIKTIEVQRGPQIASGSGSLGGTILATTKDAADLLAPGQKIGARLKFGYGSNNDEYTRSYMAYARPHEMLDILYNYTNRNSGDIMQGDGEHLQYSAVTSLSQLLKVSLFPTEDLQLTTSIVKYEQGKTIQLYDSISEFNAQFGYVLRAIDELTIAENIIYKPDNRWIDLRATFGKGHTENDETNPFGWPRNALANANTFYCDGFIRRRIDNNAASTATQSASNCRGDRYEIYKFSNTTIDIANTARVYESDALNLKVLAGYQHLDQKRTVTLNFQNPESLAVFSGYIPVSGIKTTEAVYVQPQLEWGAFSIIPGFREDHVTIKALDDTLTGLRTAGQDDTIRLKERTYSLGLAYDLVPKQLSLFANYGQGFRPASMEYQYFTNNGRIAGVPISTSACPIGTSCDDTYKAQRSENTEIGISYFNNNLFDSQIQLNSKATFYHIHTSNLITSAVVGGNPATVLSQDGKEVRNGWEFENSLYYQSLYARIGYSRISGEVTLPAQSFPLYTVPGNTFNLTMGARIGSEWDLYFSYRKVAERQVLESQPPQYTFGTQDGYELFNAGVRWAPNRNVAFRLVGENLGDKFYNLDGGFAGTLGLPGAGRNIKFYAEFTY